MRRKQVRAVGNCQAAAVMAFYRDFVGAPGGEDVAYVDDLGRTTEDLRAAVADADVIIVQERDFKHGLSKEELGGKAEVFTFPQILAGFLWPYANEPHLQNVAERPISDGPYPSQMGDSFLNRLIAKGVSPEDALDQYLALDVAKATHIDRMLELYLDRQRERDEATGIEVAPAIESSFRTEKLFLTAEHPEAQLFGLMAQQLFDKMGVPGEITRSAVQTLWRSPFPPTELPLHPGVIAHFGLSFADAETTYRYLDEGRFTFAEYVLRYMRYDNNPLLRETMFMAGRQDPAVTLESLERALPASPRSAQGLRTKGEMLERVGRAEEGIEARRQAVLLEPFEPDGHADLAQSLMRQGRTHEAEAAATRAVEIAPGLAAAHLLLAEVRFKGGDTEGALPGAEAAVRLMPGHGPAHLLLAQIRFARGDMEGGLAPAEEGLRLAPGDGGLCRAFSLVLADAGQTEAAEVFARKGMLAEPGVADHRNVLAELLERQGRRQEAIRVLEEGRRAGCENDQTFSLLGHLWLRAGVLDRAEEAFGAGAETYGHQRPDLCDGLIQVREMQRKQA